MSYGTFSKLGPNTTSFVPSSIPVTSTPVRKSTPYLALSSTADRHSSFEASVTRALLSLVLHEQLVSNPIITLRKRRS